MSTAHSSIAGAGSLTAWRRWAGSRRWLWALLAAIALWIAGEILSGASALSFLGTNATVAIVLAIAGVAQMVVMARGEGSFDLSLPYVITLGAFVSNFMLSVTGSVPLAVAVSIAVGILVGMANALLTWTFAMPAVVASLATAYVTYSATLVLEQQQGAPIGGGLERVLRAQVDGFAGMLVVGIVICAVVAGLLARTLPGRWLHAMGQSHEAARLAGIRLGRLTLVTFVIAGVLGACVGVLLSVYQGGASDGLGDPYLLGSVAAVVVGGTSISGGQTSVTGTVLGALVLTLVVSDLTISGANPGLQDVCEGMIVILTVAAKRLSGRRTSQRRTASRNQPERSARRWKG